MTWIARKCALSALLGLAVRIFYHVPYFTESSVLATLLVSTEIVPFEILVKYDVPSNVFQHRSI